MSLNLPQTPAEVRDQARQDFKSALPTSNPFDNGSFIGALVDAVALRVFDIYLQIAATLRESYPQTATGDRLDMFGSWFDVIRNPPAAATGNIIMQGVAATNIPDNTTLTSAAGGLYTSNGLSTVTASNHTTVLNRVGTEVTVTTSAPHLLATGGTVTQSAAAEPEYNGVFVVTVTRMNEYKITVTGSPVTPSVGVVDYNSALVNVTSDDFGLSTSQPAGAVLTLVSPIAGLNNQGHVDINTLGGGADAETTEPYRDRVLDTVRNPTTLFNVAAITKEARKVPGVTRVSVLEVTPEPGAVTVLFVRDDDDSIIPDVGEITTVKNQILTIKPAHTADADVVVLAPTAVPAVFLFSSITPDTVTMREAVTTSITTMIAGLDIGQTLPVDTYRAAIANTVDRQTGTPLAAFSLVTPNAPVAVTSTQIVTDGGVTYP